MPWQIVERKIGRAGSVKQRTTRQRELDGTWEFWKPFPNACQRKRPPDQCRQRAA